MSEVLASSEEQQITECEEYTLCHGEATRKKAYTSEKVKKSMASMGTEWYQKAFAPGEASLVMADEKKKKLAKRAKERQQMQQRELDEDRLRKLCAAELAAAEGFQAIERSDGREQNVFSNLTRIGLLSAIQEASVAKADSPHVAERVKAKVVPGKPGGIAAALLLPASGFVNKPNARLMRRLVTALPRGSFGREILADSMVKAAEIWVRNNPTLTAREVQMRWAFKMLDCLRRLSQVPHLDSPSLCLLFGKIQVMQGSSSYCLGNISIARQLRHWVLKEARHRDLPQPTEMLGEKKKNEVEEEVEDQGGDAKDGEGDPEGGEDPAEAAAAAQDSLSEEDQPKKPATAPGKRGKKKKRSPPLDEGFKLRLLRHYLHYAPDLTARDTGPQSRAKARLQLQAISNSKSSDIMDDKEKTRLSSFDLDNLAKYLAFNGLKNQGGMGLLAFIDDHFKGREEDKTHENIQSEASQIMRRASGSTAGLQGLPSPPPPQKQTKPVEKPGPLANLQLPVESFSMNDLGRISRFKTLMADCFAEETNGRNQGRLEVNLVKVFFAKQQRKERQKQFSDEEFDARIEQMVDKKQLQRDGNRLFEPEPGPPTRSILPTNQPTASQPPRLLQTLGEARKAREARKRLESGPVENAPPATASQQAPPTDGPPSPPPVDLLARIKVFKSLLDQCRIEHDKHVLEHGLDEAGQIPKAKIVAFFNRPGLKEKFSEAEIDACIRKMEEGNYLMESEGVIFII